MILLKYVRVHGFRGLENIEVELEKTTVLTGVNNSGKTSFLKALQLALGNRNNISREDFFVNEHGVNEIIKIDLLFLPVENTGERKSEFSEEWEILFGEAKIKQDDSGDSFIAIRTKIEFDEVKSKYKKSQYALKEWLDFYIEEEEKYWYQEDEEVNDEISFYYDELPIFYMDAQRDILEDIKQKSSYIGKTISQIKYRKEDIEKIEEDIKKLNEKVVGKSQVLKDVTETLEELKSAMDENNEKVEITPFTKKVRDLNKGLSIHYGNDNNSFPMDYHGMGTRSWTSLLTLKAFINQFEKKANNDEKVFFPIIALEEPEAHLHPHAQKKLYDQINDISGQKIISTHSPYIASKAQLSEVRNFFRSNKSTKCGKINMAELIPDEERQIKRRITNTRGELFFSKLIVLIEGETEEQALPEFAEYHFGKTSYELGIDFIGVGGHGYLPFVKFAANLNIPWLIFSDGEKDTIKKLKKSLNKYFGYSKELSEYKNVLYLENEANFEKDLMINGYSEEIINALESFYHEEYINEFIRKNHGQKKGRQKTGKVCTECKQNIYEDNIKDYLKDGGYEEALLDCISSQKTKFASIIAPAIIKSGKSLPSKILELFIKIEGIFKGENNASAD